MGSLQLKIQHSEDYRPLRARAYPPHGEQLDAIFKLAQALQAQGIELPDETQRWIAQCERVKQAHPKPTK